MRFAIKAGDIGSYTGTQGEPPVAASVFLVHADGRVDVRLQDGTSRMNVRCSPCGEPGTYGPMDLIPGANLCQPKNPADTIVGHGAAGALKPEAETQEHAEVRRKIEDLQRRLDNDLRHFDDEQRRMLLQAENEAKTVKSTAIGKAAPIDPWQHRSAGMRCKTCMWFAPKAGDVGRCRRHAPTMGGYPVVRLADWCGDHRLNEAAA